MTDASRVEDPLRALESDALASDAGWGTGDFVPRIPVMWRPIVPPSVPTLPVFPTWAIPLGRSLRAVILALVWLGHAALGQGGTLSAVGSGIMPDDLPDGTHPHESVLRANPALTLAELVRATARLDPGRFEVEGRTREASLLDRAARRWLPGPLAIRGDYLSDEVWSAEGYRQWDAMLELPVWWPGQRAPRGELARAADSALAASRTVQLLESARRVRHAVATLALARNQLELARSEWAAQSVLAERVRRAVELGEVSERERLLAESETLGRKLEYLAALEEAQHAEESYRILTGREDWPANWQEEPAPPIDLAEHPLVALARAETTAAEAHVHRLERAQWGSPTFEIGRQSERDRSGVAFNDRIVAGIRIPIGKAGTAELEEAAARRALSAARRDAARLDRALRESRARAEHQLELADRRVATSAEQASIARRHLDLTERGHALGEVDLATLLRARLRWTAAERLRREARILQQRQIAEWNQALGVIP